MHLRFLQSLVEVSAEKNHTIVLPIPVDVVTQALAMFKSESPAK